MKYGKKEMSMFESNEKNKTVFVCGAGHQGLSMAAHLALCGINVTLWNRTFEKIKDIYENKKIYCSGIIEGIAEIDKVSDKIQDVVSDFVMVTTPSSAHEDVARELAPYVHKDMIIVLNPGRTFGAVSFCRALEKYGAKEIPHIAETQTIVYTCRKNNNNSAVIYALKNDVEISALRNSSIDYIMDNMPFCLKDYFKLVPSTMNTSLSNVGMVLHCAPVLMNIGWIESEKVDFKYYYDGISPSVAAFIEKIDDERIKVAKALGFDVESVQEWMKRTYNVVGHNLFECIRNNESYSEIDAPSTINTRYIFEDIPNGLVPIEFLGKSLNIDTSNITTIINLANSVFNYDFRSSGRQIDIDTLNKYV